MFKKYLWCAVVLANVVFGSQLVIAQTVPAQLPGPDGQPGDPAKPVKVYILAGQSNMVGMGNLSGAKNIYSGVYLSSDPAVPNESIQIYKVGNYKVSNLDVFDSTGSPTSQPISSGFLVVPQTGNYVVQCGFQQTSYCSMRINGKQVYRRVF